MKHIFVDIDGVLAKYETHGKCTLDDWYEEGIFRNKKPVNCVIKEIEKSITLYNNCVFYILSASPHSWATDEKKEWLREYCSFIPEENWFFVSLSEHKVKMLEAICKRLNIDKKEVTLIDDTHSILYEAEAKGFKALHISSILD